MKKIRKILWNLKLGIEGNYLKYLSEVTKWQRLTKSQMLALQQDRLKMLLIHAYQHVPYYHTTLKEAEVINDNGQMTVRSILRIQKIFYLRFLANTAIQF